MATITISSPVVGWFFNSVLPAIRKKISDQVIKHSKLLTWLESKGAIKRNRGGPGYFFQVRLEEDNVGGATSDWGARVHGVTKPPVDGFDLYRQWDWPFMFNLFQLERFQGADEKQKLLEMGAGEANQVRQAATARICNWLVGDGTALDAKDIGTPINGLRNIVKATGTVHGISRTTYSAWQANADSVANFLGDSNNNGLSNGLEAMRSMYSACSQAKLSGDGATGIKPSVATETEEPELILTTSTGYENYEQSLEPRHRYESDNANVIKGVMYKNATVAWDRFVPTGFMWFLTAMGWEFHVVGSDLIRELGQKDELQPYARLVKLGGQGQLYNLCPRYNGELQFT
ncbi:MAG: phage major capsid protein [Planctomycetota bacterium]|nr:phage major capsid protein [Planctomycetota bacterium]